MFFAAQKVIRDNDAEIRKDGLLFLRRSVSGGGHRGIDSDASRVMLAAGGYRRDFKGTDILVVGLQFSINAVSICLLRDTIPYYFYLQNASRHCPFLAPPFRICGCGTVLYQFLLLVLFVLIP